MLQHAGSAAAPLGSRAQAQQVWLGGSVALQLVESSWIRDQICCLPALAGGFFPTEPPGKPLGHLRKERKKFFFSSKIESQKKEMDGFLSTLCNNLHELKKYSFFLG